MPVRALPGIGAVTEDTLINYGMERLGQIVRTPLRLMTRLFWKTGKVLHEHSQGIDNTDLIPFRERKSISREHTFDEDTFDVTKTFARLHALSTELAEDLRTSKVFARKLTVKLRYADFHTATKSIKVEPTNNDRLMTQSAEKLLRSLWTRRTRVRLVGIEATDFLDDLEQLYLFHTDEASPKLDKVLDGIRSKHGNIIHCAIEELR